MTSVALITAVTVAPCERPRFSAAARVIAETISWPPPMSTTTSAMTAPTLTDLTLPWNWLRALSFIVDLPKGWARLVRRPGFRRLEAGGGEDLLTPGRGHHLHPGFGK